MRLIFRKDEALTFSNEEITKFHLEYKIKAGLGELDVLVLFF